MRKSFIFRSLILVSTCAAAFGLSAAAEVTQAPFGENLEAPIPKDFKLAAKGGRPGFLQTEYVPEWESAKDWSVMLTLSAIKGVLPEPDAFSQFIAAGFQRACPHGEGYKTGDGVVNGYTHTQWMATCDLNPATNKPEFLVMRSFKGQDAFFNVQYAFRQVPSDLLIKQAVDYLDTVSMCDTRLPDRPCKAIAK